MDILATLPKTPGMAPETLWEWLKRNGKVHPQELIRYKTTRLADPLTGIREKYAACNCTACGESWHTTIALPGEGGAYPYFDTEEGPRRNGETIHCPNCGTAALVAHEKRLDRWPIVKKAYPWEIRKAGGCVMFICWAVIHETGYDWESTIVEQRNAYVIDPGGHWHRFTAMDRSGYSSMSTMYYTGCWYEMRRFQVADGNFSAILPHPADVYEGTPLENAKLELLEEQAQGIDLLHYARIYMRHPEIENIARNSPELCAALVNLTASQNGGLSVTGLDWVNWKAKKPHEALYMSKPEYKAASNSSADRYNAWMRDIADKVKVKSIETVTVGGTDYSAVNLDVADSFNVPETAYISSMPWHSGATEALPGHSDGAPGSLTNGKYPCRWAGVEMLNGAYVIGLDPLWNVTTVDGGVTYTAMACRDSEKEASSVTANHVKVAEKTFTSVNAWNYELSMQNESTESLLPDKTGGGETVGMKSAFYVYGSAGVRCPWRCGHLYHAGFAGAACANGNNSPANSNWNGVPRPTEILRHSPKLRRIALCYPC